MAMKVAGKATEDLAEVRGVVDSLLRARLGGSGLRDIQVATGEDHDGDEVLYVDVYFDLTEPLEPSLFHDLTTLLREALQRQGEERFPHLRYHFHDQQQVAGWT
jgi:hypothetical protein